MPGLFLNVFVWVGSQNNNLFLASKKLEKMLDVMSD
jgi:hypothetical protein